MNNFLALFLNRFGAVSYGGSPYRLWNLADGVLAKFCGLDPSSQIWRGGFSCYSKTF